MTKSHRAGKNEKFYSIVSSIGEFLLGTYLRSSITLS